MSWLCIKRMKNGMKKYKIYFFLTAGVGILFALLVVQVATFLILPPQSQKIEKMVVIPRGANFKDVTHLLSEQSLIEKPFYFMLVAKLIGVEKQIKPGEYVLHTHMRPMEVLSSLKKGVTHHYEVTIPEGYSIKQIAELLEKKEIVSAKDFMRLSQDTDLIRALGLQVKSMEGYLFPSTYYISKNTTSERIITRMFRIFERTYTPAMQVRAQELGFSMHEVLTLASIIEKETSAPAERGLISAVFHNRLGLRMPLQSDPTVIYAIPSFDGNLKRVHLRMDSPYNTYRRRGLPPGPIASPGKASILAALYPKSVDYLYFVSRNNGTHYFSTNFKEHNQAVAKFQKRIGKRR